jgi:hypothetical protein
MSKLLKRLSELLAPPKVELGQMDAAIKKAEEILGVTDQEVVDKVYTDAIVAISNERLKENDKLRNDVRLLQNQLAELYKNSVACCDDLVKEQEKSANLVTQNQSLFEQVLDHQDTIDVLRAEIQDLIMQPKKTVKKSKT